MNTVLLSAGVACVIAAVVGGGLKAFNIDVPVISSLARQLLLFVVGLGFLVAAWALGERTAVSTEPSVPPGGPRATAGGGAPATPPKPVPTTESSSNQPFTGTIGIRYPRFGWTLATGDELGGEVTGWTAGYQVCMSSRAEGSSAELVQGPCQVDNSAFVCSGVQLAGASGTWAYIQVVVVTDEVAGQLSDASGLPVGTAPASDETQLYKG